jgi:ADP-ribosylglycohydrolase
MVSESAPVDPLPTGDRPVEHQREDSPFCGLHRPLSGIAIPPTPPASTTTEARVRGMLLGLAIGDSLGNTSEGQTPQRRRQRYGEIRKYLPNRHAEGRRVGLPSDDTQLAFWTIESLLRAGRLDPDDLAHTFAVEQIFGIGSAVRAFQMAMCDPGRSWRDAGQKSAGNGALMRIAPIALPHLKMVNERLWHDTVIATATTHADEMAVVASVGFVGLLFECLSLPEGERPSGRWWPETFLRYARPAEVGGVYYPRTSNLKFEGTLCEMIERHVLPALDQGLSVLEAGENWYSGAYLLETVPSVLCILGLHGADPEQALVRAVNDTRDNDTIAAIVGAAVGAAHGVDALPQRWRDDLLGRTRSDDDGCVQRLIESAVQMFVRQSQRLRRQA